MLPFCDVEKSTNNWQEKNFPNALVTIGDHIRRVRLERGLFQSQVAMLLRVSEDTITYWENNRSEPSVKYYPKIIEFLGYVPFEGDRSTLGGQMKLYRYLNGLTQDQLSKRLKINESTVFHYENNNHKPAPNILKTLKCLIAAGIKAIET